MSQYKDAPPPYSVYSTLPGVHTTTYATTTTGLPPYPGQYPDVQPPYQNYGVHHPTAPHPPPPYYGATNSTTTVVVTPNPDIIVVGACPACRIGVLEDTVSFLGLLCAILFFPLGLLCCLLMREKVCSNCGAHFG